jgi:hypothetical protein
MQSVRTSKVRYAFDVTVAGQTTHIEGAGVVDSKTHDSAISMTFDLAGQEIAIETRSIGTTVYLRSPLFATLLPPGKRWLEANTDTLGAQQGLDLSSLAAGSQADQQLARLRGAEGMEKVGEEPVDGVSTAHYRGRIDLEKAAKTAGSPAAQDTIHELERRIGAKTIPVDLWIDEEHRVRRLSERMTVKTPGAAPADTRMTFTFGSFGVPVHVVAPPASQVAAMPGTSQQKS